jgi:hypothetical protein
MDIARTANLATQLRELVTELPAAARLEEALKEPDGTPAVANLLGPPSRRALSRDRGLALLSRVCGARCHAHCLRHLDSRSWLEGAAAAQFAAIGCSLFATVDGPSKGSSRRRRDSAGAISAKRTCEMGLRHATE